MPDLRRILHPTDFSEAAHAAASHAVDLAVRARAELHVLHVLEGEEDYDAVVHLAPDAEARLNTRLREEIVARMQRLDAVAREALDVSYELAEGRAPAPAIQAHAEATAADLIVMGLHGRTGLRGLRHRFFGGVAETVMRTAPCPVLAVREETGPVEAPLRTVVVPVDFSEPSERVVAEARRLAAPYGATLALLFVAEEHLIPFFSDTGLPTFSVKKVDDEIVSRAGAALRQLDESTPGPPVEATYTVRTGTPVDEIVAFAKEQQAGLIAMATHGFGRVERALLGSVTERVIRLAPCPVWTANPNALGMAAPTDA
ncbi:MAG: universal stress protein [Rhodothermales bacterium]|nr:universal stress protein [Rhodothermales bacterium]